MTLAELLADPAYSGLSDAAAADALNAPTATVQRPRVMAESELMALVSPAVVAAVVRDPLFWLFKQDVRDNNAGGVALWANLFLALGVIDATAATAIANYAAGTVGVPVSPAVAAGLGRVTVDQVADARGVA